MYLENKNKKRLKRH